MNLIVNITKHGAFFLLHTVTTLLIGVYSQCVEHSGGKKGKTTRFLSDTIIAVQ